MATSSGVPFLRKPPDPDVQAFHVLPHDHEVDVLGPLVRQRRLHVRVQPHGPQVDVLVQLEAQAQEDPLLEDAGLHVGMADGAEVDRVEPAQRLHRVVGKRLARLQVARAAPVELGEGQGDGELPSPPP